MNYTKRQQNMGQQEELALIQLGRRSSLQAQADLLELESQLAEEELDLNNLRLATTGYSLSVIGVQMLVIKELKAIQELMKAEFKAEFTEE